MEHATPDPAASDADEPTGPSLDPAPSADEQVHCLKCTARVRACHWHVLPILGESDCVAPLGVGEHLCWACDRCGYVWATRVTDHIGEAL